MRVCLLAALFGILTPVAAGHAQTQLSASALAGEAYEEGRLDEAIALQEQAALEIDANVPNMPRLRSQAWSNLAAMQLDARRCGDAELSAHRAVNLMRGQHSRLDVASVEARWVEQLVLSIWLKARAEECLGAPEAAERLLVEALERSTMMLGLNDSLVAEIALTHARVLQQAGRFGEAEVAAQQALALAPDEPQRSAALAAVRAARFALGDTADARRIEEMAEPGGADEQ